MRQIVDNNSPDIWLDRLKEHRHYENLSDFFNMSNNDYNFEEKKKVFNQDSKLKYELAEDIKSLTLRKEYWRKDSSYFKRNREKVDLLKKKYAKYYSSLNNERTNKSSKIINTS